MCTNVRYIFTGVQNTCSDIFVISLSKINYYNQRDHATVLIFYTSFIFTILISTQLTMNDNNNTATRPRSCWKAAAVIITSIVTSCVPYLKWYICRNVWSAVIFIFVFVESRTTGSNLDDTPVDVACVVYGVCPDLWKIRSSPGYVYRVPYITLNFGYCNEYFMFD